jgi:adenylate cyclase 9
MTLIWFFYLEYQFRLFSKQPTASINLITGLIITTSLLTLWATYTKVYRAYTKMLSGLYAIFLIIAFLAWIYFAELKLSSLAKFCICIICVICIYTVMPLQLYKCFLLALTFSLAFETLSYVINDKSYYQVVSGFHDIKLPKIIAIRVMLQICIHLISYHLVLMSSVRKRGTFIKVGQNLLVRRQLELEKQLKEQMIASIMPKIVADMLLKETQNDYEMSMNRNQSSDFNVKSMFRPFHMHSVKNVSILFADIVGFTNMSSKKTAEQLVEILNDLFERFDRLCGGNGCEKISTLGDCYYCVSGCPNSRVSKKYII